MQANQITIRLNEQTETVMPKECPETSKKSLAIFKEKGFSATPAISSMKASVEKLAHTENRLHEAKALKLRDRLLSLLELCAAVTLAAICVIGTGVASAASPALGVGIFFATFIAFTAFCKVRESASRKLYKEDTGHDRESTGMLYPLAPIGNVGFAFSRCSRLETQATEDRKNLVSDLQEAEQYVTRSYDTLSKLLDEDIKQTESSLRGLERLKVKPKGGVEELTQTIAGLKTARTELELLRNFFLELKKQTTPKA